MRQLLLMLLLMLPASAFAETYPIQAVDTRGKHGNAMASATCVGHIGRKAVFLTNRHVVKGMNKLYVSNGKEWIEATNVRVSNNEDEDLMSFEVKEDDWEETPLMTGIPDEQDVQACGYSPARESFCFDAVLWKNKVWARNKQHVIPGDSGGAIIIRDEESRPYIGGIIFGYGKYERNTWYVTSEACRTHLTRIYGSSPRCYQYSQRCPQNNCGPRSGCGPGNSCPPPLNGYDQGQYRRYEKVTPRLFAPPRIERYEERIIQKKRGDFPEPPSEEKPEPTPDPISNNEIAVIVQQIIKNDSSVRGIIREEVEIYFKAHAAKFKGEPGENGKDGKSCDCDLSDLGCNCTGDGDCKCGENGGCQCDGDVTVDLDALTDLLVSKYGSQLKGETGEKGDKGDKGDDGEDGAKGRVNVVIMKDGTLVDRFENLVSGSTVVVDHEKYEVD